MFIFPCLDDHEQDCQPYPVNPYSATCDDYTYIRVRPMKSIMETIQPLILYYTTLYYDGTVR